MHRERPAIDEHLVCRCGLRIHREKMVDYLCPECRLARILTEHARPSPDRVMSDLPGRDAGLFSSKGQEIP